MLEACFADLLRCLVFDDQLMCKMVFAYQTSVYDWEGSNPHCDVFFRQPFDVLAITNTTWQREKAAGIASSDLCPIRLPTAERRVFCYSYRRITRGSTFIALRAGT